MRPYKKEDSIWRRMLYRCFNPAYVGYSLYGGKGIRVCESWKSFENFLNDMGACPDHLNAISRYDENKDFEKTNCFWSLAKVGRPITEKTIIKRKHKIRLKNPRLVNIRMENSYYEFLNRQALKRSLDEGVKITVSHLICEALEAQCPAPKQLDIFTERK